MKKTLIYDFPTRIFHWLFSGLFVSAFVIAKTVEDESIIFSYHMLIGLTLGFLVLLRLIWAFAGTRHAKFSDFALNPTELFQYLKGIITGDKKKWAGHNPASSWAALSMIFFALLSALTGYGMTSGAGKESLEDIHEFSANAFLVIALAHIAGVILHSIRYREILALSMVTGKKSGISSDEAIPKTHVGVGILLLGLILAFGFSLFKNYDVQSGKLHFFGTTLILGENKSISE